MYSRNGQLGAAFLTRGSPPPGVDMRTTSRRDTGQAQKFSYPNNQCPRGYQQTGSGSDKPPRGYSPPWGDYVLCRPPTPAAAPAPQQAPAPTTNITVSPAIQTDVSPQISPIFQQTQDSPGAVQAGSATQSKPGGQRASGGGTDAGGGGGDGTSAAMLEFLRAQSEREDRRIEQENERRRQLEAQQREQEKQNAEIAARNAELEAQYQAKLQESQKQTPSTFQTEVMPGQTFIPARESEPEIMATEVQAERTVNWPLIVGGVVIVGGLVYFVAYRK